jgi:hypothetical protein
MSTKDNPEPLPAAPPLPAVRPATAQQVLLELHRERKVRARVYPEWAHNQKNGLTPAVAAHRLACIDAAIELIQQLVPQQGTLPL